MRISQPDIYHILARRRKNSHSRFLFAVMVVFCLAQPGAVSASDSLRKESYQITLAGERILIELPFPVPTFIQSAPDDAVQSAVSVRRDPFIEVSLSAAPTTPITPNGKLLPGAADIDTLHTLRIEQSAQALPTHSIHFFDRLSGSLSNQVSIPLRPVAKEAVVVHEWVEQAHDHSWTFRISYTPGNHFDESLLDQIVIRFIGPAWPNGSHPSLTERSGGTAPVPGTAEAVLPTPSWWDGECDTNHYNAAAGQPAYSLGGVYRGVKACGPRPWSDGAPDVLIRFYPGAWGEYEWECVELSMRFLYLAYTISPYPGNGKDVVANYPGTRLVKVSNGTALRGPKPGDVLSYGPTTAYGHTAVVSAANLDSTGNGTITVIEQNSSVKGEKTHQVVNWFVQSSQTVSGWLHDPSGDISLPVAQFLPFVSFGE